MGHESRIELWSPTDRGSALLVFGTDRLRREQAMKTAGRENPNRCAKVASNRAHGAAAQNRSCSITWAAKQENFQPMERCFFLTSPFIELIRSWHSLAMMARAIASPPRNGLLNTRTWLEPSPSSQSVLGGSTKSGRVTINSLRTRSKWLDLQGLEVRGVRLASASPPLFPNHIRDARAEDLWRCRPGAAQDSRRR